MTRLAKLMILATSAAAFAAPAYAVDLPESFQTLDSNADARVEFTEFKAFTDTQGIGSTLAAQHFTRMAAGDFILTESEFEMARFQAPLDSTPADFAPSVIDVPVASVVTSEAVQPEAVMSSGLATPPETEPPVTTDDLDGDTATDFDTEISTDEPVALPEGSVITTEPVEDVAGDVETYSSDTEYGTTDDTPDAETDFDIDVDADTTLETDEFDLEEGSDFDTDLPAEEDPLN